MNVETGEIPSFSFGNLEKRRSPEIKREMHKYRVVCGFYTYFYIC